MSRLRRLAVPALVIATLLPAIYLFVAIQHGALTVPFWDHCEQVRLFEKVRTGTLSIGDLWASHNHSRPFTFRVIVLMNGLLTDWDLRSEYAYVFAAIFGALLLHLRALRRLLAFEAEPVRFWAFAAAFAVLACTPVGHNNHWWSMMLQLDLANLFIVGALTTIGLAPRRFASNVIAAVCCWLATWTLTNGLVAFAVCAGVAWLTAERAPWRDRRVWFWAANIALAALCYFPGLKESASPTKPGPLAVLAFAAVYLGMPVRGLVSFPYRSALELPRDWGVECAFGCAVVAAVALLAWMQRERLRRREPGALLFVAFGVFAVGSALLTAWGRAAFDDYGIANANGSRYAIFSSYLLFGALYFAASAPPRVVAAQPRVALRALAGLALLGLAAKSYGDGWRVYHDSHRRDRELRDYYAVDRDLGHPVIYPGAEHEYRDAQRALRIGAYRGVMPAEDQALLDLPVRKTRDTFDIDGVRADGEHGLVLFAHPDSRYELELKAPAEALDVAFGVQSGAVERGACDGVEFKVAVRTVDGTEREVWRRAVTPLTVPADRGLLRARVPLGAAAGDTVLLDTGPLATTTDDWAFWKTIAPVAAGGPPATIGTR